MRFFPPTTSNNLKGTGLIFYCKDCEKVVDVIPVGRKFVYKCAICKTKNVAFGTEKSIRNFFHVEEEKAGTAAASAAPEKPAPSSAMPETGK
jgi:hypothetical protein